MRDKYVLLVGLALIATVVAGAAPWRSLSPCLIDKWTGITATDGAGNLVGSEDPNDWGCIDGGASGLSVTAPTDVPVPPPTAVCLLPAFPNPASASTTLRFTLPSPSQVSLVVYGKKGNGPHGAFPVRTLVAREMATGMYTVVWDGNDDRGVRVVPDIYRVAMVVSDNCVCGDIEIH
jgi:hypothetical protein